jgi:uracil-DNA glycosylase
MENKENRGEKKDAEPYIIDFDLLPDSWKPCFRDEYIRECMEVIREQVFCESLKFRIIPDSDKLFRVFSETPFDKVSVVLLTYYPFHSIKKNKLTNKWQSVSNGLCFSVDKGMPIPPAIHNIYKELTNDQKLVPPFNNSDSESNNGCNDHWAKQGVLMLHNVLTSRAVCNSHASMWTPFTNHLLTYISDNAKQNIVFVLLGKSSIDRARYIYTNNRHKIITGCNPSPLGGIGGNKFIGCGIFSEINEFLVNNGQTPINFRVPRQKS